ncbi:MAG: hypothetical protein HOP29_04020 [Phycisphaerales bacterium]|nr:hypothetical protein [Phycisphaerales bacterium]
MKRTTISLGICAIVLNAAPTIAQLPRVFIVRANALPSTNVSGRLQVNDATQGGTVCLDLCGSSPAPGLHKAIQLRIGDATGGVAGTVTINCASVAIDTSAPTHPGNTLNVTGLGNCVGAPPNDALYAYSNFNGSNMTIGETGRYLGEACWTVSANACGAFAIDYIGNTCQNGGGGGCGHTLFTGPGTSSTVAITDDGADLNMVPAKDDCADCNMNGIPDECDINDCPSMTPACDDCNVNGVPDACDVMNGTSADQMPPLGVPDECSFWISVVGPWSSAPFWSPPVVPTIQLDRDFAVTIAGMDKMVFLDIEAKIRALRLRGGAMLTLATGSLRLAGPSRVLNNGTLTIQNGRMLVAESEVELIGTGAVRLGGPTASLASQGAPLGGVWINQSLVVGEGVITARLVNENAVSANQPGGTLRIVGNSPKTNNGTMTAVNGGTLVINNTMITGSGDYVVNGGAMRVEGTLPGLTTSVAGNALFIANGTVMSAPDTTIVLEGALSIGAGGLYTGTSETAPSEGSAAVQVAGGAVSAGCVDVGCDGGMVVSGGMTVTSKGAYTMTGSVARRPAGGCAPPSLVTAGVAASAAGAVGGAVVIDGDFVVVESAQISYASPEPMRLSGDFDNGSVEPDVFDWTDGGLLLVGPMPHTYEAAGVDLGPDLNGFSLNFAMGSLAITDGGDVLFEDSLDNDGAGQSPCSEAVYVYNLVIAPGASATIDGCRVYYAHRVGGGVSTIGCGEAILVPTGDRDGDRDVDRFDYQGFVQCAAQAATATGCETYDRDRDDDVDVIDFARFQSAFGAVSLEG